LTWGRYNRKALIRIPIVPTNAEGQPTAAETIEFRLPDGSTHPHLLLAGIAQAIVAGHAVPNPAELLARTAVTAEGASAAATRVPLTFGEVADEVDRSRDVLQAGSVFTPNLLDRVVALLRA
jgi:glutamine synthetase